MSLTFWPENVKRKVHSGNLSVVGQINSVWRLVAGLDFRPGYTEFVVDNVPLHSASVCPSSSHSTNCSASISPLYILNGSMHNKLSVPRSLYLCWTVKTCGNAPIYSLRCGLELLLFLHHRRIVQCCLSPTAVLPPGPSLRNYLVPCRLRCLKILQGKHGNSISWLHVSSRDR